MEQGGVHLRLLDVIGVNPHKPLRRPLIIFNYTIAFFVSVLVLLQIIIEKEVEGMEAASIFFQIFVKYGMLVFNRRAIINIINKTKQFWEVDTLDEKTTSHIQYLKKIEKFCLIFLAFGLLVFLTKPFIVKGTTSIYNCYIPAHLPFLSIYFTEVYFTVFLSFAYTAVNIIISRLILAVTTQFRTLNLKIKSVDYVGASSDDFSLRKCVVDMENVVKYHYSLIRFVENLNNILSTYVAFAMICSVGLLCVNMYILAQMDSAAADRYTAVVISVGITCEFFLVLGYPLQLLMDEAADTANIIYCDCPWYLPNIIPLRKSLGLIILRSQKSISIRAANYHIVNNETILLMLKTAYSFFTFFQTLE